MFTGSVRLDAERSFETVELEVWARRAEAANGFGDSIPWESPRRRAGARTGCSILDSLDEEYEA